MLAVLKKGGHPISERVGTNSQTVIIQVQGGIYPITIEGRELGNIDLGKEDFK